MFQREQQTAYLSLSYLPGLPSSRSIPSASSPFLSLLYPQASLLQRAGAPLARPTTARRQRFMRLGIRELCKGGSPTGAFYGRRPNFASRGMTSLLFGGSRPAASGMVVCGEPANGAGCCKEASHRCFMPEPSWCREGPAASMQRGRCWPVMQSVASTEEGGRLACCVATSAMLQACNPLASAACRMGRDVVGSLVLR